MIPVFEPAIATQDIDAVVAALKRGELSGNFGESLEGFEREFAEYCGCRFGIATSSGTTALQLAVASVGIGRGDDVLISSSTNIATALAAVHCGAMPVPVDAETDSWNMDVRLAESLITPRTRAIIPVHLFGAPVDMSALTRLAAAHGLAIIEDCAEAHGATHHGQKVGSFGAFGCFSFYTNKVITTGEGGMLTTNDPDLARRARYLRNVAFGTPRFVHEEAGYNFRMTGYQAALGRSQLGRIDAVIEAKRQLAQRYALRLGALPHIRQQRVNASDRSVHWVIAITLDKQAGLSRDQLADFLRQNGIDTRTFFCPMNQQPCLLNLEGFAPAACPVADDLWQDGLYLPSSPDLDDQTLDFITGKISEAFQSVRGAG
jgi:perosamine synthetase